MSEKLNIRHEKSMIFEVHRFGDFCTNIKSVWLGLIIKYKLVFGLPWKSSKAPIITDCVKHVGHELAQIFEVRRLGY